MTHFALYPVAKCGDCGVATCPTLPLGYIPCLRRPALESPRHLATRVRTIPLPVEAPFTEVEPPAAFLALDRPDSNRHGLAQFRRETGRRPRDVRRRTRPPRPRGDTGGLGAVHSEPSASRLRPLAISAESPQPLFSAVPRARPGWTIFREQGWVISGERPSAGAPVGDPGAGRRPPRGPDEP